MEEYWKRAKEQEQELKEILQQKRELCIKMRTLLINLKG